MALLLIAVVLVGRLTWYALLLPVVWLSQLMFMMGVVWLIASFNVFIKDMQYIIATLILFLMMVSPIAYTVEMAPAGMRFLLWFNPLSHMIISYQNILMQDRFPGWHFWCFVVISLLAFYLGYLIFSRLKKIFADNI
jgi:lipopolysaccharide transport system permease protein